MLMLNMPMLKVVHATGTLKAFLDARTRGAPHEELKALWLADEASREAAGDFPPVEKRARSDGNVIYLPDRKA